MAKACCAEKTTKKTAVPSEGQLINWRINLKNGQNVDLNMIDGDSYDKSLTKWIDAVAKGSKKYYTGKFPGGEAWISGAEVATAIRAPAHSAPKPPEEEFQRVD